MLRQKTLLPDWFYYYAMLSNFCLRFSWTLTFVPKSSWVESGQLIILFQTFGEGFRRAQWSLIRLENEQLHNLEKYRTILAIPAVKED